MEWETVSSRVGVCSHVGTCTHTSCTCVPVCAHARAVYFLCAISRVHTRVPRGSLYYLQDSASSFLLTPGSRSTGWGKQTHTQLAHSTPEAAKTHEA